MCNQASADIESYKTFGWSRIASVHPQWMGPSTCPFALNTFIRFTFSTILVHFENSHITRKFSPHHFSPILPFFFYVYPPPAAAYNWHWQICIKDKHFSCECLYATHLVLLLHIWLNSLHVCRVNMLIYSRNDRHFCCRSSVFTYRHRRLSLWPFAISNSLYRAT